MYKNYLFPKILQTWEVIQPDAENLSQSNRTYRKKKTKVSKLKHATFFSAQTAHIFSLFGQETLLLTTQYLCNIINKIISFKQHSVHKKTM